MIESVVLDLARRQHGIVGRTQLMDGLGVSRSQISRALSAGRLVAMLPSVYLVAPAPESLLARCMAAQLHTGLEGFVSGWSAGRLRGLRRMQDSPIHYTVPCGNRRRVPSWIELHVTKWYDRDRDRDHLDGGLFVATPMRMLFGLAAAFGQRRFEGAAEDAWHLELVGPVEAADYLERHRCRGKDGVTTIERWLERALDQHRPAQSYFERDLIDALRDVGLPEPVRQHPVTLRGGLVIHIDIAWPDIRLGIEPGHTWWHGGDRAVERDALRDLACGEIGWQIQRLTEHARRDLTAAARRLRILHWRRTADITTDRPS